MNKAKFLLFLLFAAISWPGILLQLISGFFRGPHVFDNIYNESESLIISGIFWALSFAIGNSTLWLILAIWSSVVVLFFALFLLINGFSSPPMYFFGDWMD